MPTLPGAQALAALLFLVQDPAPQGEAVQVESPAGTGLPFQLDVAATTTYQTLSGSANDGDAVVGYLDLFAQRKLWEGALGVLELEAIGGNGPDDLVPSFGGTLFGWNGLGGSSQDSDGIDRLYVAEAYLSMPLFDPDLIVTFGKIASVSYLDTNRAANDQTTQFLSGDFTNSAAFQAPYRAAGVAFSYVGCEHLGIDVVAMRPDNSGVNATDDVFAGGQVGLHYDALGGEGNCNTYVWVSGDRDDQTGLGLSLDQDLREDATAFARLAWQEEKPSFPDTLARAWSAGLEWRGPFHSPEGDALGLGFGRNTSHDGALDEEGVFEAYFRHGINDHVEASLHLQSRSHPAGDPLEDRVLAFGVRLQVCM
jgi:hypothetical protein